MFQIPDSIRALSSPPTITLPPRENGQSKTNSINFKDAANSVNVESSDDEDSSEEDSDSDLENRNTLSIVRFAREVSFKVTQSFALNSK